MKDKFQIGDLVRVALALSHERNRLHPQGRLGIIISKVSDVFIGDDALEYDVMFGNKITRWYGSSLEKVESKGENKE